jgi:hypothetical protein
MTWRNQQALASFKVAFAAFAAAGQCPLPGNPISLFLGAGQLKAQILNQHTPSMA